jgi:hypothetical protein
MTFTYKTAESQGRLQELRSHQVYRLERQPQRSILRRLRRTIRARFAR